MSQQPQLFRHGDVLLLRVDAVPADARATPGTTLARGEVTGHAHQIAEADGRAKLLRTAAQLFVRVERAATLVHEEHGPIVLDPGVYRVWRQREYVPAPAGTTDVVRFVPVQD